MEWISPLYWISWCRRFTSCSRVARNLAHCNSRVLELKAVARLVRADWTDSSHWPFSLALIPFLTSSHKTLRLRSFKFVIHRVWFIKLPVVVNCAIYQTTSPRLGIESKKACLVQWLFSCSFSILASVFLPALADANPYEKPYNTTLQLHFLPNYRTRGFIHDTLFSRISRKLRDSWKFNSWTAISQVWWNVLWAIGPKKKVREILNVNYQLATNSWK